MGNKNAAGDKYCLKIKDLSRTLTTESGRNANRHKPENVQEIRGFSELSLNVSLKILHKISI